MKTWCGLAGIGLWLALGGGGAAAKEVPGQIEASMLVTGAIEVNPDGSLRDYGLDRPEKLPPGVLQVIDQSVRHWTFTYTGAANEPVRSRVNLRIVAVPAANDSMQVRVAGVTLLPYEDAPETTVTQDNNGHYPDYPQRLLRARVSGTVYVALRVGRDGKLMDAVAEQVNLDQRVTAGEAKVYRESLAQSTLRAAQQWSFKTPSRGEDAHAPYWVVRLAVTYAFERPGDNYGQWKVYVPGPRERAPWISGALLAQAPDALPDGVLQGSAAPLRLSTPLGGS